MQAESILPAIDAENKRGILKHLRSEETRNDCLAVGKAKESRKEPVTFTLLHQSLS
jgi:hypothetical protein